MWMQLWTLESNPAALDTFPAILSNSFIQQQKSELAQLQQQSAQLSEKFGEKHPEIIKNRTAIQSAQLKLQAEIAKVVAAVRTEYQAARAQESSLSYALSQQKSEALAMNRKGIEYSVLERDVESGKQLYESLLQRAKETGVATELKSSNIRVIDNAPAAAIDGDAKLLGQALNALMFAHRRELSTGNELCVAIDRVTGGDQPGIRVTIGGADRLAEVRRLAPAELEPLVEVRGGVGFKLSLARDLIERHGGLSRSRTEPPSSPDGQPTLVGAVVILPEA